LGPTLDIQIKLRQRYDLEGSGEVDSVEDAVLTHQHLLAIALEEVSHPQDDVAMYSFVRPTERLQLRVRPAVFRKVSVVAILIACPVMPFLRFGPLDLNTADGACHQSASTGDSAAGRDEERNARQDHRRYLHRGL
jgi:hypothetical protein